MNTPLLSHYAGSTCELDSQPGRYNPGMQWLASGVLEWVRQLLWTPETPWQTLIDEARALPDGAQKVKMQCDLLSSPNAGWQGITLNTTRGHFYLAALEGLAEQLANNLQTLQKSVNLTPANCCWSAAAAATRCGIRSKPTGWISRLKYWMTPKPPSPAPPCLAGMASVNSAARSRPERK